MASLVVNQESLNRIKSYLNDPLYKEAIEHSASYNTRLCIERKMRLPFLDAQTGVAQNNCTLWMHKRNRMPGERPGQLYTYPAKRWRKRRRQYLVNFLRPRVRDPAETQESDFNAATTVEAASASSSSAGGTGEEKEEQSQPTQPQTQQQQQNQQQQQQQRMGEDSKDSWYRDYEEQVEPPETAEMDDAESDYDDYEETYTKRKKKKQPAQRGAKRRSMGFDPATEQEKPYQCDLCGARYKTRPGLSYHTSHSHGANSVVAAAAAAAAAAAGSGGGGGAGTVGGVASTAVAASPAAGSGSSSVLAAASDSNSNSNAGAASAIGDGESHEEGGGAPLSPASAAAAAAAADPLAGLKKYQDSFLSFLNHPETPTNQEREGRWPTLFPRAPKSTATSNTTAIVATSTTSSTTATAGVASASAGVASANTTTIIQPGAKPGTNPSPYCDFCLGDANENKKTRQAEELVSCSDCGRSGHPTCLQFTSNMMISVKKYRWQCIECKCCTICGTSDNDDQLLFCDDCDRGYHMYCLEPPLSEPPEGSWSCHLCIVEFHKK